jgi:osmotically inducible lipoprotein OsmB
MKTTLKLLAVSALVATMSGCAGWSSAEKGAAVGAVGGGVVGSAVSGGSTLGTLGGAAAGGIIGHEVGESRDRRGR